MKSPAAAKARVVRGVLESVMLELEELTADDTNLPARSSLAAALAATSALEESALRDSDHFERLERAQQAIQYASSLLGESPDETSQGLSKRIRGADHALAEVRSDTIDALVSVQGSVPPPARKEAAAAGFRGSAGDKPLIQLLDRPPLRIDPVVGPLDEEIPPHPTAIEDLPDEPAVVHRLQVLGGDKSTIPELDISEAGEAGERALTQRLMRDCLEEMGSLAIMMMHTDRDVFDQDAQAERETRLTRDLDALLALGETFTTLHGDTVRIDVLAETLRYSRDDFVHDPRRAFARAFVLGSVAGSDAVHAAVYGLRQSVQDVYDAQAQALALAVNPRIPDAMVELLHEDGDTNLVTVALDVLRAHRKSEFANTQVLLQHADPEIRWRAARNLAHCDVREAAVEAISSMLEDEIDDEVRAMAHGTLVSLDVKKGRELLRQDLEDVDAWSEQARDYLICLLGMAGNAGDVELLRRLHEASPVASRYADLALGLHGHVDHVETLLGYLDRHAYTLPQSRLRSVANALIRITGAPLQVQTTSEHYDFYQPRTEQDVWTAWWQLNEEKFEPEVRYRFGQPFVPLNIALELRRNRQPFVVRKMCAAELALYTRPLVALERWVADQREAVESAHASLSAATPADGAHTPGTWL